MSVELTVLLFWFGYIFFGIITATIMFIIAKDRALRAEADGNLDEMRQYWYSHDTFEYSLLYDSCRYLNTTICIILWPFIAVYMIVKLIMIMPDKISNILMKDTKYIKEGDKYIKTKRKDPEFEEER